MNKAPRASFLIILVGLFGLVGCQLSYKGGAKPVTPAQLDAGWLRAAPTPVVKQRALTDCGLAALASVAGAWGRQWTVEELAREAPPTKKGVKLKRLRELARSRGLEAFAISGTFADLRRELKQGRPVLVGLVLPYEQDRAVAHYEVVVALDPRDDSVMTLDPSTGKYLRRTRKVLETEWKPAGFATLVVVGDRAVARR